MASGLEFIVDFAADGVLHAALIVSLTECQAVVDMISVIGGTR
jgi:hypothetical protein